MCKALVLLFKFLSVRERYCAMNAANGICRVKEIDKYILSSLKIVRSEGNRTGPFLGVSSVALQRS